eukprot:574442-Rhodomonas_salina.1
MDSGRSFVVSLFSFLVRLQILVSGEEREGEGEGRREVEGGAHVDEVIEFDHPSLAIQGFDHSLVTPRPKHVSPGHPTLLLPLSTVLFGFNIRVGS